MTFAPANSQNAYIPTYLNLQVDEEQLRIVLSNYLTLLAYGVNIREISQYDTVELLTGKQFFSTGNAQQKRYGFRKCFNVDPIASGGTLLIPHGLAPSLCTYIGGGVATVLPDFRPLPYASVAGTAATIDVRVDGTNIIIVNGSAGTAPAITAGVVIIEYLKT